jgi:hypothetical protein
MSFICFYDVRVLTVQFIDAHWYVSQYANHWQLLLLFILHLVPVLASILLVALVELWVINEPHLFYVRVFLAHRPYANQYSTHQTHFVFQFREVETELLFLEYTMPVIALGCILNAETRVTISKQAVIMYATLFLISECMASNTTGSQAIITQSMFNNLYVIAEQEANKLLQLNKDLLSEHLFLTAQETDYCVPEAHIHGIRGLYRIQYANWFATANKYGIARKFV